MAIFSKQDAHLPFLTTQFYQLSFDPKNLTGSELEIWLTSWYAKQETAHRLALEQGVRVIPDWQAFMLSEAARCHAVVRRLMDAHIDSVEPDNADQQYLKDALERTRTYAWDWVLIDDKPSGYERRLRVVEKGVDAGDISGWLRRDVLSAFVSAAIGDRLFRCNICCSVAEANRENQRYCSRRCANTDWARRNKQTKQLK